MPTTLARWANVKRLSSFVAKKYWIRRSVFMRWAMSGRWSLMTASRPSCSLHAWTWAIDAAERGTSSKAAKISSGGAPSCSSTRRRTVAGSNGRTSSSILRQASASGAGKRLGELAISWPSFTNVGPSWSNPSTTPSDAAVANDRP